MAAKKKTADKVSKTVVAKTPAKAAKSNGSAAEGAGGKVDWATQKTLTGAATRIPALVTTLRDEKTMRAAVDAWWSLRAALVRDHAVAPCAPLAATLLLDAVASGKPGARYAAQLIGEVLTGGHTSYLQAPAATITGPVEEVRAIVHARVDVLHAALGSDSGKLRAGAAFALAFVPEVKEVTLAALRRLLVSEPDDDAALSLGISFGWLARGSMSSEDRAALAAARLSERAGARAGAGVASLIAGEEELRGLGEVAPILAPSYNIVIQVAWAPWGGGSEEDALSAIARGLGQEVRFAKALIDSVVLPSSAQARSAVAWIALQVAELPKPASMWAVPEASELSPQARDVAMALCRFPGILNLPTNLPRSVHTRRRWLGLSAPGALEKTIALDGRQLPLWKAWSDEASRTNSAEWPAAVLAALTPDEIVEAYGEVLTFAYNIMANRRAPSIAPVLQALPQTTDGASKWAHRYLDEVGGSYAAEDWTECGNVKAIPGAAAVYLALDARREAIPDVVLPFFPAHDPVVAKYLLEHLSPDVAEKAIWAWKEPFAAEWKLRVLGPLLPAIRSRRIIDHFAECLEELARATPSSPGIAAARTALQAVS